MYEGMVKNGPTHEDYDDRPSLASGATMGEQVTTSMVAILDQENKIRDDPMLAIKRKEQAKIEEVRNNPLKMHQIKQTPAELKRIAKLDKKIKKAMRGDGGGKKEKKKKETKEKTEKKDEDHRGERQDTQPVEGVTHLDWERKRHAAKLAQNKELGLGLKFKFWPGGW